MIDNDRREPEMLAFGPGSSSALIILTVLSYIKEEDEVYLYEPYIPSIRLDETWYDMSQGRKGARNNPPIRDLHRSRRLRVRCPN